MAGLSTTFQPDPAPDPFALCRSALAWWVAAGVTEAIAPDPRPWLDRPVPAPAHRSRDTATAPVPSPAERSALGPEMPAPLPTDLPAFRAWLATVELPELPAGGARVVAEGPERAAFAVVVAQPMVRDSLLAPPARRLLEAMLRAIGLSLDAVALLPVVPSAIGPRLRDEAAAAWRPLIARHLALVGADRALLLGDGPCRALLGQPVGRARGRWHDVNHRGATLDVMASFDLTTLLDHPACKREAWGDLLAFSGEPT